MCICSYGQGVRVQVWSWSAQGIAKEEEVLRVPLRLALTDHPGDEESNRLLFQVRLADPMYSETATQSGGVETQLCRSITVAHFDTC
jgi:hypothetical protein